MRTQCAWILIQSRSRLQKYSIHARRTLANLSFSWIRGLFWLFFFGSVTFVALLCVYRWKKKEISKIWPNSICFCTFMNDLCTNQYNQITHILSFFSRALFNNFYLTDFFLSILPSKKGSKKLWNVVALELAGRFFFGISVYIYI